MIRDGKIIQKLRKEMMMSIFDKLKNAAQQAAEQAVVQTVPAPLNLGSAAMANGFCGNSIF